MKTITRKVGPYELVRVIGRGGMATVYLARQTHLDRYVALKQLELFDGSDPQLARRFLREARMAGSLSHPNIVTVHDYLERNGTPYIAMEYLARGSLRPCVGALTLAQVGGVLQGMLGGLAHAEEHEIVHRDIKPENIMVTAQGSVKIADFGIAKATSAAAPGANLTTTGTTLGTPRYMAPERAMGQEVGPWSDIYSIGVMAFELLVGRAPFHDTEAPMAVLMRQINDPIPPVRSLVPEVDPALSDWVEHLLVKDPERRLRSASAAWSELDEILVGALGARWLRDAPLPARPEAPPARDAPAAETSAPTPRRRARATGTSTPAPRRRARATGTNAPTPRRRAAPATTPLEPDGALAATVAPGTYVLERPPRSAPRRRLRVPGPARLALVAGTLIVAVATVVAMARGGDDPRRAGHRTAVTAGNGELGITAPPRWHKAGRGSSVALPLADPITVAGAGGSVTGGVMQGETAANVSLLPPDFLRSLGLPDGQIPPRTRVTLRDHQVEAWRYRGLRPNGSARPLTVFAVPTSAGVAALVCVPAAAAAARFERECGSIADTLQLRTAQAYPVGPSADYADALDGALGVLRGRAKAHASGLQAAATPTARAAALRMLAGDYDGAARSLEQLDLSPADHATNTRLVTALDATSRAYRNAAAGAGHGGGVTAGADVEQGQIAIDGALASLRAAGYTTRAGAGGLSVTEDAGAGAPAPDSGVGDSRSDDPSDDEPDEEDNGD